MNDTDTGTGSSPTDDAFAAEVRRMLALRAEDIPVLARPPGSTGRASAGNGAAPPVVPALTAPAVEADWTPGTGGLPPARGRRRWGPVLAAAAVVLGVVGLGLATRADQPDRTRAATAVKTAESDLRSGDLLLPPRSGSDLELRSVEQEPVWIAGGDASAVSVYGPPDDVGAGGVLVRIRSGTAGAGPATGPPVPATDSALLADLGARFTPRFDQLAWTTDDGRLVMVQRQSGAVTLDELVMVGEAVAASPDAPEPSYLPDGWVHRYRTDQLAIEGLEVVVASYLGPGDSQTTVASFPTELPPDVAGATWILPPAETTVEQVEVRGTDGLLVVHQWSRLADGSLNEQVGRVYSTLVWQEGGWTHAITASTRPGRPVRSVADLAEDLQPIGVDEARAELDGGTP